MEVLTPGQCRITILAGSGLKTAEIAQLMGTTEGVIKNSIIEIFTRTGISNRVGLALRYTKELEVGTYDTTRLSKVLSDLKSRVRRLQSTR